MEKLRGLLREQTWLFGVGLLLGSWALIRPWGEYPLNDDWVYARITKHLAETFAFKVDVGCSTSLLGQAILGALVVKLFGFSHRNLRCLTMLLGLLGLWLVDRLLVAVGVRPRVRGLLSAVLALNPLYQYLSASFMSEIYGWVPALGAALLWFSARRRRAGLSGALISLRTAMLVGLLSGLTFWVRQFAVLVLPSLFLGSLLPLVLRRQWQRVKVSLPALLASTAVCVATLGLFFFVTRASGAEANSHVADHARAILEVDLNATLVDGGMLTVYLTAFLLPLLLWLPWEGGSWRNGIRALVLLALLFHVRGHIVAAADSDFGPWQTVHRVFPYAGNVLHNAGIGPVTLDDVWHAGLPAPRWPRQTWVVIEAALLLASVFWVPFFTRTRRIVREGTELEQEALVFGLGLSLSSFLAFSQAYKLLGFDRYYIPCVLGTGIAVAVMASPSHVRWPRMRALATLACLLPVGWFSVAGVHDQFRWNDARWLLVRTALAAGADRNSIQAGLEVNGWLDYDDRLSHRVSPTCIGGRCGCAFPGFDCMDDSYRVGMNLLGSYVPLAKVEPGYWLAPGPPLILSQRLGPW